MVHHQERTRKFINKWTSGCSAWAAATLARCSRGVIIRRVEAQPPLCWPWPRRHNCTPDTLRSWYWLLHSCSLLNGVPFASNLTCSIKHRSNRRLSLTLLTIQKWEALKIGSNNNFKYCSSSKETQTYTFRKRVFSTKMLANQLILNKTAGIE